MVERSVNSAFTFYNCAISVSIAGTIGRDIHSHSHSRPDRRGEDKGHLEFVTFMAENRIITAKRTAVNVATSVEDFSKIVPMDEAANIVSKLRAGARVLFPGFWHLDEIKHKFGGSGNE